MAVIKMLAKITGTRNAVEWPDPGETYELPDDEAAALVASKLARYAKGQAQFKSATHVDHSGDVIAANEASRAKAADKPETADDDEDDDAESTVLSSRRIGRK